MKIILLTLNLLKVKSIKTKRMNMDDSKLISLEEKDKIQQKELYKLHL